MSKTALFVFFLAYIICTCWGRILNIPSLSRPSDLGFFYDKITDSVILLSGIKEGLPRNASCFLHDPNAIIKYKKVRSFEEQMDSLSLDSSASASISCGLVEMEGTLKYLSENKLDHEHEQAALRYSTSTTVELLALEKKDILLRIDAGLGRHVGATHIIIGIQWGTDSVYVAKWKSSESSMTSSFGAGISASYSGPAISARIDGSTETLKSSLNGKQELEFTAFGNINLSNFSVKSMADVESMMSTTPEQIRKVNGGKGIPLSYYIMALEDIEKLQNRHNTLHEPKTPSWQSGNEENEILLHRLQSKVKTNYQSYRNGLILLEEKRQQYAKYSQILPQKVILELDNLARNYQDAFEILQIRMKYILIEARKNTTNSSINRLDEITEDYQKSANGPNATFSSIKNFESFNQKIQDFKLLNSLGISFINMTNNFDEVRLRLKKVTDYFHLFVYKEEQEVSHSNSWYDSVECLTKLGGEKVYIDCGLEDLSTACKPFDKMLTGGPFIKSYTRTNFTLIASYLPFMVPLRLFG